ncbi:hypothetical protein VLK31_05060 [Variovorax sp. H27-G14]|uniref:DUF6883 domain-containing protein n=1 Tax=Variovorax sp. H27-G14 TaxID=3111914 RepID=UPI0038FCFA3A
MKEKGMQHQNGPSEFVAFLFDADHSFFAAPEESNYAHSTEQRFLEAIAKSSSENDCAAKILRGDVLMHEIASTLQRFTRNISKGGESRTYGTNRRRLATAIGDVTDSFTEAWCTLDLIDLPARMGSSNIFCLSAFPISFELAKSIDELLNSFPPYLGAIQLDPGNPLHVTLFHELLDCVFFLEGTIYTSEYSTGEGYHQFGIHPEDFFKIKNLSYLEFQRQAPKLVIPSSFSERGFATAQRVGQVLAPTYFENIAVALERIRPEGQNHSDIDLVLIPPDVDQLFIPIDKLLKYSLSTEHETGKHKARLFSNLLAISSAEWRYLAYQISAGLPFSKIENVRNTEHGIKHSARINVIGLNGNSLTVQTGWIIRFGTPTQMTTAYPADKSQHIPGTGIPPPWVDTSIRGDSRWKAIHTLAKIAGEQAYKECIPIPMKIEGCPIILEGKCGNSRVTLDGRSAFARWLIKNNCASAGFRSGVHVYATGLSQSIDRSTAYAKKYASVLWLNGIETKIESNLS